MDLSVLELGALHLFRDWPNRELPRAAAGVYTIWRDADLMYAGMAGRGAEQLTSGRRTGLVDRLGAHANGRRSGNQFCVYVCDRIVVPALSRDEVASLGSGALSLDACVRAYVRRRLGYRFLVTTGAVEARAIEARVRAGELSAGPPLLNPTRR